MKIRSVFIASGSGSVGGATLSRNKGGMYLRTRSIPTNPNTARQVAVRAALGQLASYWTNVLTPEQRVAWNLYAQNVTVTNPLGEAIQLSGQQHFIRSNVPRLQAELDIVDDGPTTFNLGDFESPTLEGPSPSTHTFSIAFNNTEPWASVDGSAILVYGGRPQSPGISFFKGPFRYAGKIVGATVNPGSPVEMNSAYPLSVDNLLWSRVQLSQVDGRLSQSLILGPVIIES